MPIKITQAEMNAMLIGVEHGIRQHEKGQNLQAALTSVYEQFEVEKPRQSRRGFDCNNTDSPSGDPSPY